MTPRFASAVDPVFRRGLMLLERIQRGDALDAAEEQQHLLATLEHGSIMAGGSPDWELARYALVSWLDELLVDSPWSGQDWWSNNVLEEALYQTRDCHERFYLMAGRAAEATRRDALQVYHDCVVLGFRGLYRPSPHTAELTRRHRLPSTVAEWLRRTQLSIRVGGDRQPLVRATRMIPGARPLTASVQAIWAWTAAALMLALNAVCYHLWLT